MNIINNPTFKKVIGILVSVFILSIAYYGTYLPLRKSQAFIDSLKNLNSVNSLTAIEQELSGPLNMPSPIGKEELVRNVANIFLSSLQQNNDPKAIDEIVGYVEKNFQPIVDYGRGMSFEQNMYILGAINEFAFVKTHDAKFLEASQRYYERGLELGPNRPQFLYGMFDIYRIEGNVEGAKTIASKILSQWPDDTRTQEGLAQFLSTVQNATASKSK
ncbi:MAG: hypothetical protein KGJ89_03685 [Patescibacteria group bacterium]|nr:hypothetical protein [Patescibacteria group bacterium]MDE2015225.1 hypothetical protein [Patescibacteria group bacterium]MDE2227031.1 hypothetical protein [Patescibacteria group bacterium]